MSQTSVQISFKDVDTLKGIYYGLCHISPFDFAVKQNQIMSELKLVLDHLDEDREDS